MKPKETTSVLLFRSIVCLFMSFCICNSVKAKTFNNSKLTSIDSLITEAAISIPIVLNFEASRNKNKVNLSWTCAIECNNKFYLVQRSLDDKNFQSIAKVKSSTISDNQTFLVKDENPASGSVFYRLLLKLPDGNFTQLDKVKLKTAFVRNQTIISGEVEDYLKIRDNNFELGDVVKITITDANGSFVMGQNVIITSDVIELNLIGLTSGNYYLTAKTGLYELKARFKKL